MKTVIQNLESKRWAAVAGQARAFHGLKHGPTLGDLRQLLVTELLKEQVTSHFQIGSGIIVNFAGKQSRQTDIVLYDQRIMRPFAEKLFPVESVIATIEVKSHLGKGEIAGQRRGCRVGADMQAQQRRYGFPV